MTLLLCVADDAGRVAIGSDLAVTRGSLVVCKRGPKWTDLDDWRIACAGATVASRYLREFAADHADASWLAASPERQIDAVASHLYRRHHEDGHHRVDNGHGVTLGDYLAVHCPTGRMWHASGDGGLTEYERELAVGSGEDLAYGAIAMARSLQPGQRADTLARSVLSVVGGLAGSVSGAVVEIVTDPAR